MDGWQWANILGYFVGVVGLLIGVIGLIVTIKAARDGRQAVQKPDLRYAMESEGLIGANAELLTGGLSIMYNEKTINSLCRTRIAIWNHRGSVVRHEDIVKSDALRIEVGDDDSILRLQVLARSGEQIGFQCTPHVNIEKTAFITFDYLAAGDGAVLELMHERRVLPKIKGTVRGCSFTAINAGSLDEDSRRRIATPNFRNKISGQRSKLASFGMTVLGFGFVLLVIQIVSVFILRVSKAPMMSFYKRFQGIADMPKVDYQSMIDWQIGIYESLLPAFIVGIIVIPILMAIIVASSRPHGLPSSVVKQEAPFGTGSGQSQETQEALFDVSPIVETQDSET